MATYTNWSATPEIRPWAKDLDYGDTLTEAQANAVCATRLRDFGYELVQYDDDLFQVCYAPRSDLSAKPA
jgi:hypothetical protein